jgi:hypothetical protein
MVMENFTIQTAKQRIKDIGLKMNSMELAESTMKSRKTKLTVMLRSATLTSMTLKISGSSTKVSFWETWGMEKVW